MHDGDSMKDITIYEEPRKGSVKRVQGLKNRWYLKHMPLDKLDQQMSFEKAFNECIKKDPELMCEFLEFQQDIEDAQEIMLATALTYDDVKRLEDELSVKEFDEFVVKCKEATGGIVNFFDESGSGTNLTNRKNQPETSECTSSPGQPGGSTQE